MSRAESLLLLTAVLAGASGGVLLAGDLPVVITAIAGALLALGVPGYALSRAFFAGSRLDAVERVALVLGLDFSLIVVLGFLLHLSPAGLGASSWGISLAAIALVACVIAAIRDARAARAPNVSDLGVASDGTGATNAVPVSASSRGVSASQQWLLIGAGALVLVALVVARAGVTVQPHPGTTALWIRPADDGTGIRVGIANSEGRATVYRLEVDVAGTLTESVPEVTIADGVTEVRHIALPRAGAVLREIEVHLWRAADPAAGPPYRSVRLSLRATAPIAVPAGTPAPGTPAPGTPAPGTSTAP